MRKKSHVSLSRYLLNNIDSELLENHRKAFIVGSVLPDCKPSFVTTKHNMEETFDMVCEFIRKLTVNSDDYKKISTAYCRKLGEVLTTIWRIILHFHIIVYLQVLSGSIVSMKKS